MGHMRKRILSEKPGDKATRLVKEPDWLGMETSAEVEVTSEDADYPMESALGILPG